MNKLPPSEFYFPVSRNPFSFKTGLIKLEPNNKDNKHKIFQIDSDWLQYHQQKMSARQESLAKYVLSKRLDKAIENKACQYIIETLCEQQSEFFSCESNSELRQFHNRISGEIIHYNSEYNLISTTNSIAPAYINLLDALCCQLQEDFSLVHVNEQHDNLVYLHLCFPNYWSGENKIGKCFSGAHKYVPAMENISKSSEQLNELLKTQGPFERFTWGITTDKRLNHHPVAPAGIPQAEWYGRQITADSPLYLRVERQVTAPFPLESAYMFSIRTYFVELEHSSAEQLERLIVSIESMSDDILKYKGIAQSKVLLISRLKQFSAAKI